MEIRKTTMKTLLITMFLATIIGTAKADQPFSGYIGAQLPSGTPDRPKDDSPQFIGGIVFPNLIGKLTLSADVQHSLRDNFESHSFNDENKFVVKGELPLCSRFVVFSFFERRYSSNDNRIVVGCKVPFSGRF